MPGFIKTKEQERLWQKAQDIAEKAGKKDNWAYVTGIYKKMNGGKVAVERIAARHLANSQSSRLSGLLATLRTAYTLHTTAHWQTKGPTFYGDHELFERLYKGLPDEIDALAEKLVATFGPASVDPVEQVKLMRDMVESFASTEALPSMSLRVEHEIQSRIRECLAELGDGHVGLTNFLEDLADKHDTGIYLLGQRTAAQRVAARHLKG
jgi:DNA-binding ferritin-like protein